MDLTEIEDIKKRWQEYREELYKKDLQDPDNHDDVITNLEPDILECEVKWALEIITMNKVSGADGGSDHELLIAKFRLKSKEVEKTTRSFRYDLNQIPYDYTGEVRNSFKGLDLIDRVPDELWTEVWDIVQETGIKIIPVEKKCKKQNGCLGRPYK